jgi:hypothetical protein
MCNVQRETQRPSAAAKLGLGRLFERHQERDGGLGVRAEVWDSTPAGARLTATSFTARRSARCDRAAAPATGDRPGVIIRATS